MQTSKQKPELTLPNRATDGGTRILARLEHGGRSTPTPASASGWSIDGWTISLGVLLTTLCTVAWLVHDNTIRPGQFAHSRSKLHRHVSPQLAVATVPEQPAAIINETPAERLPLTTRASGPSGRGGPGDLTLASASSSVPVVHRTPAAEPTRASNAAHRPPSAAHITAHANNTKSPAYGAPNDSDVTLLTAMVAHASRTSQNNPISAITPETNRDVVERQEGDSTAQLLSRCKQLGLIEGMLCRSRICSGRWDADPACSAPSH